MINSLLLYVRWIITLPFYVTFFTFALIATPVMPLFRKDSYGAIDNANEYGIEPRLPWYLDWFQTQDNSLWGDNGWQTKHCPEFKTYFGMVKWLWRNPAYGFAVYLGIGPNEEGFMHEFSAIGLRFRIGYLDGGLKGMYLLSIRIKD